MAETFIFSPRPNRAHEIEWRAWGPAAFDEALRLDRPVLLNLTATWCHWCQLMDETTYSTAELIERINASTIPIRVDADCMPHVQDRYIAGGWPTNAFLTPTGEVLWSGTYVDPAEFTSVTDAVLGAWDSRRDELRVEIERRRRAMEAARSRQPAAGLVRREAADDVLAATQEAFDPRNGGFGGEPKFPVPEAIEPLYVHARRSGNADWRLMAERTLEGMLAGELWDAVEGGFFRYALAADWTSPRCEKLLDANAGMLRAYALGAALQQRDDWRATAESIVVWVDATLAQPSGLWSGSQVADEEYFRGDAHARRARTAAPVDDTVHTDRNAQWIRALAEAGGRLRKQQWIARAAAALDVLLRDMAAPGDALYHYRRAGGTPELAGLLVDQIAVAHACLAVAQATGEAAWLAHARRLADAAQRLLWADDGGFYDHVSSGVDVGALRYRDRPFETNAWAARLFNDLALATGERGYRAIAERVLALLSPLAGRYGVAGAVFALAVEEFFEAPTRVAVVGVGAGADELRAAALALPLPDRRVWTLPAGGRIGPFNFPLQDAPAAYVCGASSCSAAIGDPLALETVAPSAR